MRIADLVGQLAGGPADGDFVAGPQAAVQPMAKCLALDALDMDFNPSRQVSAGRRGDRETMAHFLVVEEREKLAAATGEIGHWAGQRDLQNERAERVELVQLWRAPLRRPSRR